MTEQQVEKLREIHGLNELAEPEKESIFEKIKEQFEDKLVRILLISAIISFVVSYFGKSSKSKNLKKKYFEKNYLFFINYK